MNRSQPCTLSVVVPCYNEEATLALAVDRVLAIERPDVKLEVVVVDDCSQDKSRQIAKELAQKHPQIRLAFHEVNQGKGAALRTGFAEATGDFVAVQDADLEYDPQELLELIEPLRADQADVVLGSRYLTGKTKRALYFWHTLGNKLLTLLSNMFTDLYLTDMETCYKVFKREVIQSIEIEENRFGFEPEIVAKVAQQSLRVYEIGISYYGRTYEEGKKIGLKDAFRALYCIFHYNAPFAPLPIQLMIYFFIGSVSALFNLGFFWALERHGGLGLSASAGAAYFLAGLVNYWLCIQLLFKHQARWSSTVELLLYLLVVAGGGYLDVLATGWLIGLGLSSLKAKAAASVILFLLNFLLRKFLVFPQKPLPRH